MIPADLDATARAAAMDAGPRTSLADFVRPIRDAYPGVDVVDIAGLWRRWVRDGGGPSSHDPTTGLRRAP